MPAIAQAYSDEIREMLDGLEGFLRAEVMPRHAKHEKLLGDPRRKFGEDGRYSDAVNELITEIRMASATAGYYTICVPEAMGGGGMNMLAYYAFWERLFHRCGAKYWLGHFAGSHWSKGPSPVLNGLSATLRKSLMPDLLNGRSTLCFALSEPGAGSDAAAIRTRAEPDGTGWRLTGSKIWTTNSPHADFAMVFAVTDAEAAAKRRGGISLFLVPTQAPGFRREGVIRMWGSPGSDEAMLHFDAVRLEPEQLVGELGKGFRVAMLGVGLGRLYNAARSVGVARWAIEMAFDYAKVRETFGRTIANYQGVTFPLAESAMEIHAAQLMGMNVAGLLDRGLSATKELAMAKAYAVEAAARAVDRAMQTHGAMGFTNEMYLTDAYVMMRKINVADGTNEILRRAIAKAMLDGDTDL